MTAEIIAGGGPEDPVGDAFAARQVLRERRTTRKTPGRYPGTTRTETTTQRGGQTHRRVTTRSPIESDSGGTQIETFTYGPPAPSSGNNGSPSGNGSSPGNQGQSQSASGPSILGGSALKGNTYHRWVMAEFVACIVIIAVTPLIGTPKNADGTEVDTSTKNILFGADSLVRMSAVCFAFFILSLLANGEKSGKFAAAFGGLITAGLLVNTPSDFWTKIGSLFGGGVGSGTQSEQASSENSASGPLAKIEALANTIGNSNVAANLPGPSNEYVQAVQNVLSWVKSLF